MGFFRILLRILTFGILGKERSAEEVYVRRKLAIEKEQKEVLKKKQREELVRKRLEQRRSQLLKAKK